MKCISFATVQHLSDQESMLLRASSRPRQSAVTQGEAYDGPGCNALRSTVKLILCISNVPANVCERHKIADAMRDQDRDDLRHHFRSCI